MLCGYALRKIPTAQAWPFATCIVLQATQVRWASRLVNGGNQVEIHMRAIAKYLNDRPMLHCAHHMDSTSPARSPLSPIGRLYCRGQIRWLGNAIRRRSSE